MELRIADNTSSSLAGASNFDETKPASAKRSPQSLAGGSSVEQFRSPHASTYHVEKTTTKPFATRATQQVTKTRLLSADETSRREQIKTLGRTRDSFDTISFHTMSTKPPDLAGSQRTGPNISLIKSPRDQQTALLASSTRGQPTKPLSSVPQGQSTRSHSGSPSSQPTIPYASSLRGQPTKPYASSPPGQLNIPFASSPRGKPIKPYSSSPSDQPTILFASSTRGQPALPSANSSHNQPTKLVASYHHGGPMIPLESSYHGKSSSSLDCSPRDIQALMQGELSSEQNDRDEVLHEWRNTDVKRYNCKDTSLSCAWNYGNSGQSTYELSSDMVGHEAKKSQREAEIRESQSQDNADFATEHQTADKFGDMRSDGYELQRCTSSTSDLDHFYLYHHDQQKTSSTNMHQDTATKLSNALTQSYAHQTEIPETLVLRQPASPVLTPSHEKRMARIWTPKPYLGKFTSRRLDDEILSNDHLSQEENGNACDASYLNVLTSTPNKEYLNLYWDSRRPRHGSTSSPVTGLSALKHPTLQGHMKENIWSHSQPSRASTAEMHSNVQCLPVQQLDIASGATMSSTESNGTQQAGGLASNSAPTSVDRDKSTEQAGKQNEMTQAVLKQLTTVLPPNVIRDLNILQNKSAYEPPSSEPSTLEIKLINPRQQNKHKKDITSDYELLMCRRMSTQQSNKQKANDSTVTTKVKSISNAATSSTEPTAGTTRAIRQQSRKGWIKQAFDDSTPNPQD